jgi:mannose-6-phosphate isomerase-like protein (cupin superfamily)
MEPKFVKKSWGWELWFANVQEVVGLPLDETMVQQTRKIDYCGKMLCVTYGNWSSKGKFHYHKIKDETFFVIDGKLELEYFDENLSLPVQVILKENESFRVPAGMKHRFTSYMKIGCIFIEVSTFHSDDDSYRCQWDKEKREWVE